jgi:acyl carrier protein
MQTTLAFTPHDVIDYLQNDLAVDQELDEQSPLFSTGLLDSVSMMNLILFIEQRSGAEVRPSDVTLDNFDTVARIIAYAATLA